MPNRVHFSFPPAYGHTATKQYAMGTFIVSYYSGSHSVDVKYIFARQAIRFDLQVVQRDNHCWPRKKNKKNKISLFGVLFFFSHPSRHLFHIIFGRLKQNRLRGENKEKEGWCCLVLYTSTRTQLITRGVAALRKTTPSALLRSADFFFCFFFVFFCGHNQTLAGLVAAAAHSPSIWCRRGGPTSCSFLSWWPQAGHKSRNVICWWAPTLVAPRCAPALSVFAPCGLNKKKKKKYFQIYF